MAKKEGRRPVSSFVALIVGLVLIVSMVLPFYTITDNAGGPYETYSESGLTLASGDPTHGIGGNSLLYLIPLGGIIGALFAALTLMPKMRLNARVSWVLVFVGGLLALVGGVDMILRIGPHFVAPLGLEVTFIGFSIGIGLLGALILGSVEIVVAAMMILRE